MIIQPQPVSNYRSFAGRLGFPSALLYALLWCSSIESYHIAMSHLSPLRCMGDVLVQCLFCNCCCMGVRVHVRECITLLNRARASIELQMVIVTATDHGLLALLEQAVHALEALEWEIQVLQKRFQNLDWESLRT